MFVGLVSFHLAPSVAALSLLSTRHIYSRQGKALPPPPPSAGDRSSKHGGSVLSAEVLRTIEQDYGVGRQNAEQILQAQDEATRVYPALKEFLGPSYAGAWFDAEARKLIAATTDPKMLEWIESAGAEPVLFEYSLEELRALSSFIRTELESNRADSGITGLLRDIRSNRILVFVSNERQGARLRDSHLRTFSGFPVDFVVSGDQGQFFTGALLGGDGIVNPDFQFGGSSQPCSVGFAVQGGFITAGHCGWSPHEVDNQYGSWIGNFLSSSFPPVIVYQDPVEGIPPTLIGPDQMFDYAFVATNDHYAAFGYVGDWLEIDGSLELPVGSTVCRYGAETGGPNCGQIISRDYDWENAQVAGYADLPNGIGFSTTFPDMILTNISIVANGDSGGPLVGIHGASNTVQAQGLLSAGSVGSGTTNTTWYTPVDRALDDMGLSLVTAADFIPMPLPPCSSGAPEARSFRSDVSPDCTIAPPGPPNPVMGIDRGLGLRCTIGSGKRQKDASRFFCSIDPVLYSHFDGRVEWHGSSGVSRTAHNGYFGECPVGAQIEVRVIVYARDRIDEVRRITC